jgi:type II secretory pathway component PulF
MCSAGLSISTILKTLEQQTESQGFRSVITDIRKSVESGSTLKSAFEKHREVFSDFFIGMVEAGEAGGKLSKTLEISANYLEKQADIKRKLKSAFAYPITVGTMCLLIVAALIIFIIPVFSKLYKSLHVPLPIPTQILINTSIIIREKWWTIIPLIVAGIFLFIHLIKNPNIKIHWDKFKLNMPIFAKLNRMVVVSNFIRTFSLLISTGISVFKALEVASLVVNNTITTEIACQMQKSIETGNSVGSSLKEHSIFPPIISQLAISGEKAGMLPDMLNKGVDFLDKDIEHMTKAMLVKLEPALTVIMGTIVGFILIAVYLPMFDYMTHFK